MGESRALPRLGFPAWAPALGTPGPRGAGAHSGCAQRVRRTARRHPSVPSPLEALSSPQTRRPTPRVGPAARRGAGGCPCRSGHSVPSGSHGGEPGAGGSRRAARLLCSFHRRRQFYRLAGDRTLAGLTALIQRAAGPGPHRKAPSELWGGRKAGPPRGGAVIRARFSPPRRTPGPLPGGGPCSGLAVPRPSPRHLLRRHFPHAPAGDVVPLTPSSAMRRVGAAPRPSPPTWIRPAAALLRARASAEGPRGLREASAEGAVDGLSVSLAGEMTLCSEPLSPL